MSQRDFLSKANKTESGELAPVKTLNTFKTD